MDNRFLEAYRAIEAYDTIVIHRHTKPDGDAQGERLTDACKTVAAATGYRKQDLYQQAIPERESE